MHSCLTETIGPIVMVFVWKLINLSCSCSRQNGMPGIKKWNEKTYILLFYCSFILCIDCSDIRARYHSKVYQDISNQNIDSHNTYQTYILTIKLSHKIHQTSVLLHVYIIASISHIWCCLKYCGAYRASVQSIIDKIRIESMFRYRALNGIEQQIIFTIENIFIKLGTIVSEIIASPGLTMSDNWYSAHSTDSLQTSCDVTLCQQEVLSEY